MTQPLTPPVRSTRAGHAPCRRAVLAALAATGLGGCALLLPAEPPKVNVIGLERVALSGFELRFNLKLRVQNPNGRDIEFDGLAVDLDVNGRPLATGVTAEKGTLPRFGETVITLPVSVNAVATVRQMLGLADGSVRSDLPYVLRGRVGTGGGATLRFSSEGVLRLPS